MLVVGIGNGIVGFERSFLEFRPDVGEEVGSAFATVPFVEVTGESFLIRFDFVVVVVRRNFVGEDGLQGEILLVFGVEASTPVVLKNLERIPECVGRRGIASNDGEVIFFAIIEDAFFLHRGLIIRVGFIVVFGVSRAGTEEESFGDFVGFGHDGSGFSVFGDQASFAFKGKTERSEVAGGRIRAHGIEPSREFWD